MKVTQEKLPASQVGLQIEITPEMSKQAYEQVIQEFTRSANIPGFRKGKVPRQVLIQRFGVLRLKAAALEELIDSSLKKAIEQEKIEALGNWQLRSSFEELITQFDPGSSLTFSASVDVQPTVALADYTGLSVQAEEVKPDPERVDQVLKQYQEQSATLIPVEGRNAQEKDIAVVDFRGALVSEDPEAEPEEFPGGQADDFQVELTEGKFIPGFIEGIVGMAVGETKDVRIEFPADYPQADLAGRPVVFTITLKELKERELPELDDDFAQEVSEFETLAALRESLETRFQKEAEDKTTANKEQAILDELVKLVQVDLPETLVDRELSYMINQTAVQLQNQGLDVRQLFTQDTIAMLKERSRPEAITRLQRTLALGEVAKQQEIKVEPEEVNTKVNEILADLGDSRDIDPKRLATVVSEDLLKEKILAWLLEHSTVELVPEGTLAKPEPVDSEDLEETSDADEDKATGAPAATTEVSTTTTTVDVAATTIAPTEAETATAEPQSTSVQATSTETAAEEETATPTKRKSTKTKAKPPATEE